MRKEEKVMYAFNDYLRQLIKQRNISISKLARMTQIERTSLQKSLSGTGRILPYDSLNKIASFLQITLSEKKKLYQYYNELFESEDVRESREIINDMFIELAQIDFARTAFKQQEAQISLTEYIEQQSVFIGKSNIKPLLRIVFLEAMKKEDASIRLTVPLTEEFLGDELLYIYLYEKLNMEINHIVVFDTSNDINQINCHNLKNFKQVLSISLASKRRYHPYYYYENAIEAQYMNPFPYYIVTQDCVICLSKNCNQAMILHSEDQVIFYNKHFEMLLKECSSLIHYTENPIEVLDTYDKCTDDNGFYMAMSQSCFGCFYTKEVIDQFVKKDFPFYNQLKEIAYKRFKKLCEVPQFYTFFTEEGFKRFIRTGQLDDFPEELVKVFPREMRTYLVRRFINAIKEGKITAGIMKEGMFPAYLSLTTSNNSDIGIFTTKQFPIKNGFSSIEIKEPGLCKAFHEWLLHLPNSSDVLSMEETLEVLTKYI